MSYGTFITVNHNGEQIYDIAQAEHVPAIGDQLELADIGESGGLYTVMGRTWDLVNRTCDLDVELTDLKP